MSFIPNLGECAKQGQACSCHVLLLLCRCCCCPGLLFLKVWALLGTTCLDLFLFAQNSARSQEPTQLQVCGWTFSANVFSRVLARLHPLGTCLEGPSKYDASGCHVEWETQPRRVAVTICLLCTRLRRVAKG